MMEGTVVSSSSFSVFTVASGPRRVVRDGISVAKGLKGDRLCGKPASQASELESCFSRPPTLFFRR